MRVWTARPPRRLTSARFSFRADDPVRTKRRPAAFDEAMHFVEQSGQPLYLVYEYPVPTGYCLQLAGESSHVSQVALVQGLVEQVDAIRVRVFAAHPCRLAVPRGPNREKDERGAASMRDR